MRHPPLVECPHCRGVMCEDHPHDHLPSEFMPCAACLEMVHASYNGFSAHRCRKRLPPLPPANPSIMSSTLGSLGFECSCGKDHHLAKWEASK